MSQVQEAIKLVNNFFDGDWHRTLNWFTTSNPLLGGVEPIDMVDLKGECPKLMKFIKYQLEENKEH